MAIAKGTEVKETSIKRYIGVAQCRVLAVNPTQEKLNEIMGYERTLKPYVEPAKEDGTPVRARIDFIVATDPEVHGVEEKAILTYYVNEQKNEGSKSGSIQVIDEYGRTAWGQPEVVAAKKPIMYVRKDGSGETFPANCTTNYREALVGEEDLTNFLQTFLNIPNVQKWDNNAKRFTNELVAHPENSECRLDRIKNIFKGDFKEIASAIACQPANKVKLLWGIRTVERDGQVRTYPAIYNKMVLRAKQTDYSRLEADVTDRKANGQYSDTEFQICEFQEYVVEPTDLASSDPLGAPADDGIGGGWGI